MGSRHAAHPCQEGQVNRMADLPPVLMQRIIALLDHSSRLELRKVDKRSGQLVDSCCRQVLCVFAMHAVGDLAACVFSWHVCCTCIVRGLVCNAHSTGGKTAVCMSAVQCLQKP